MNAKRFTSRMVRRLKGDIIKRGLLVRNYNNRKPEGWELFASTPPLVSPPGVTAQGSVQVNKQLEDVVLAVNTVTQAFSHGRIDCEVVIKLPRDLHGLQIRVAGKPLRLSPDVWYIVLRAL